jgi:hypothetical protein
VFWFSKLMADACALPGYILMAYHAWAIDYNIS